IQIIPREDAELRDQFLFIEGAVNGRGSGRGREAFRQLLESSSDRSLQRIALQQIVTSGERGFLREVLEQLIETEIAHPLLDELLISRAQSALLEADYGGAVEDADRVLAEFPGSRLKGDALRLLASVAWEQGQFRTAADYLTRLRSDLVDGREREIIGVLVADCFFRAEDYVNAADAYGIALRDNLEEVSKGLLVYQRTLAELRAGRLDRAKGGLDEFAPASVLESEYRWQAEWNLVKTMQKQGRGDDAFVRLERFFSSAGPAPLPESLLLRFQWLIAQLSHEAGDVETTIEVVDDLMIRLSQIRLNDGGGSLEATLTSNAMLLKARALLAQDRSAEALPLLDEIRSDYSGSRPAIYSYLVEARYQVRAGHIPEAQEMLLSLAEAHAHSEYAPIALYEAAVNSRRSGTGEGHQERAIVLFEKVVQQYPAHDLAFYARIQQGDILRELNRFGAARQVYESLANNYPDHPDWFRAKIALADSHLAQAVMGDAASFRRALVELERLFDLPGLTSDMRAEAGFKYAFAYEKSGSSARAEEIHWLLISAILHDDGALTRLGTKGRYWLSRSIFELGRLFEKSEEWEKAREIYGLIFSHQLPGLSLAEARLSPLPSQ
ncbi:MAG: tetratricopeptide repeat protein, partial [Opitutales bacterium]